MGAEELSWSIFIHGLDSSNQGTKSVFFKETALTWLSLISPAPWMSG